MRHTMRQFGLGDVTSVDAWTPIRITLAEYFATGQIEKPRTVAEFEAYEGIKAVFPTQAMLNDYVVNLVAYKARLAATPPTEPLQPFQVEAAAKIYAVLKGKAAMGQALKAQDQLAVALTLVDPKDAKSVAAVKAAEVAVQAATQATSQAKQDLVTARSAEGAGESQGAKAPVPQGWTPPSVNTNRLMLAALAVALGGWFWYRRRNP